MINKNVSIYWCLININRMFFALGFFLAKHLCLMLLASIDSKLTRTRLCTLLHHYLTGFKLTESQQAEILNNVNLLKSVRSALKTSIRQRFNIPCESLRLILKNLSWNHVIQVHQRLTVVHAAKVKVEMCNWFMEEIWAEWWLFKQDLVYRRGPLLFERPHEQ